MRPKYFFRLSKKKKKFPTRAGKVRILVQRFLFPGIISSCHIFNRVHDPNQLSALHSLFQPMSVSLTMTCVATCNTWEDLFNEAIINVSEDDLSDDIVAKYSTV